jgi:hypothetical protein
MTKLTLVERFFNRIKQCRSAYDKLAAQLPCFRPARFDQGESTKGYLEAGNALPEYGPIYVPVFLIPRASLEAWREP